MADIENIWRCIVPVATVWTTKESARTIDAPAIDMPVNLAKWLHVLTYNERLDLCDANRVQTQLLYGEEVIVEEIVDGWAKIFCIHQPSKKDKRGYPGWVPLAQLKKGKLPKYEKYVIVTGNKVPLYMDDGTILFEIPFNTILPLINADSFFYHVVINHGIGSIAKSGAEITSHSITGNSSTMEQAVLRGTAFLNLPYLWGGMSSYGYDCSGFTYNMAKASGIIIPRDAGDQKEAGQKVNQHNPDEWRIGDLLFFSDDHGRAKVRHVGFYYGDGKMIHSPKTGKNIEIIPLAGTVFEDELCGVSRYQP